MKKDVKQAQTPHTAASGVSPAGAPRRRRRFAIQALGALILNGNWSGFVSGRIYTGPTKGLCVPVLNCYSCPGALGACPIGSLQAVVNERKFSFSYFVVGLLALFGLTLGRWFCGWLCPFGWIQELLYRLPVPKLRLPRRLDRVLRYLKYLVLGLFVIALPLLLLDPYGFSDPFFCKWICPAGTLEAGLPLLAANPPLRAAAGLRFGWKVFLLLGTILAVTTIFRAFCRYVCPLGAIYGLCNPVSLYHLSHDEEKCTHCGLCARACKMNVDPSLVPNSPECIRCGDCIAACPEGALCASMRRNDTRPTPGRAPKSESHPPAESLHNATTCCPSSQNHR